MPAPTVYVSITKPYPNITQGLASLDVNPRVTEVSVETQAGGFGACNVGLLPPDADRPLVYPSLPGPVEVEDMAHVVVTVGGHVLHEGVVQRIAARRDGFESLGYGVAAGNWASLDQGGEEKAVTDRIALAAIAAVPWFVIGEVPGSSSYRTWNETQYMPAAQVIDTLVAEGSGGVGWQYHVYDDRVVRITTLTPPTTPTYRVAYDPTTMDIAWDYSERADAVRATYQDADGRQRVTSWVYRDGADQSSAYLRRVTLSTSGAATTTMQFLQAWIAEHGAPVLSGSINLDGWRGLTLPGGAEVPGYLIRSGQWLELEGFGVVPITRTSANLTTGTTSITLGTPPSSSLTGLLTRLQQSDAALRSKRDPVSRNRM